MLLSGRHLHLLPLLLLISACDGCPSRSKPYTPYTLDPSSSSTAPAPSDSAGAPPAAPTTGADPGAAALTDGGTAPLDAGASETGTGAGAAAREVGVPPPEGDGKRWPLEGAAAAEAPTGRSFETGLLLDADGDGVRDLVAWARSPDGLRGELLFVPGANPAAARTIAALPGGLSARGCTPQVTLTRLGAATLTFDYAPQCAPGQGEKATRWLAILRTARPKPADAPAPEEQQGPAAPYLALDARVRQPAAGEALAAEVEAADRDGDGREDVVLTFALTTAAPDAVSARAPLVYLDRPAGLSRDAAQPGESLRALAAGLNADAGRKGSAATVAPRGRAIRRLHALLCSDAGGEPIVAVGAGALKCGDLDLEATLGRAESRAAATLERK